MFNKVLDFWFIDIEPAKWWQKSDDFDDLVTGMFKELHQQARKAELYEWRVIPRGRLAEIILLDQFSRNIFRNTPESFAYDPLALLLAQKAVAIHADDELTQDERNFLYMPYMHSESLKMHELAVELFTKNGLQNSLDYELKHKAIIDRFGRYPHRNKILGRQSTEEEIEFLKQPGSEF